MKHLPNVVLREEVPYEQFNHADFLWGIDANTVVYNRVIEIIQKFDAKEKLANKYNK